MSDELKTTEEPTLVPGVGRAIDLLVQNKTAGLRLDQFLVLHCPDFSRSILQKAIEAQCVLINDAATKPSTKVKSGDRVRIWLPNPERPEPAAEDIPLEILYEDEWLALVNKPFNMVVHPAKGNWSGTLVNALAWHFNELSTLGGEYRPGIVHRLDRDTSGVILVAKEEATHRDLSLQFENRKVFKEYVAITQGTLDRDSDYIERRIGHHKHDRVKMAISDDEDDDAKDAVTFYEVIERFRGYTFVRLHPKTGRTLQLRVHLASVGAPVLADKLYSGRDCFRLSDLTPIRKGDGTPKITGPVPFSDAHMDLAKDEVLMPRQALHAWRLRVWHPKKKEVIAVQAPLPPEFEKTLAALRQHRAI